MLLVKNESKTSEIISFLTSSPLFSDVDEGILHDLARELEYVNSPSGEVIMREGELGKCLYILMSGRLRVVKQYGEQDEKLLNEIEPGNTVGELELFISDKNSATVVTDEASKLLVISKDDYYKITEKYPSVAKRLNKTVVAYLRRNQLRSALNSSLRFGALGSSILQDLQAKLQWQTLLNGETLVQQGSCCDSLYLISVGRVRLVVEHPGKEDEVIDEIGRGESVGEVAFFTNQPHPHTVYAVRDTEVAKLSHESFDELLNKYPSAITRTFSHTIIKRLSKRLSEGKQFTNTVKTMAIVPTSPQVPLSDFTARLVKCVSKINPEILHLTSEEVDKQLGKPGIAQDDIDVWDAVDVTLVSWFSEQETKYDYVVYEADSTSTAWSRRCIREADHIVLVGKANSVPSLSQIESKLRLHEPGRHSNSRKSLVLLHDNSTKLPSGTKEWLERRQVEHHYHIRRDRDADFERLARILTGNAISLVLSGGGARGLAHIGTIRALREANIPIDMIGGTSQGSLISGLAAMNWDAERISRECSKVITSPKYNFPMVALASGKAWTNALKKLFGEIQIEDLWLNYFCVSANLTRANMKVHKSGLLWKSVRASSSVPGILPPISDAQDLLVDGGVLSNLPVEVMRQHNHGGKIIASDVSATANMQVTTPIEGAINGLYVLWRKVTRKPLGIPAINDILMQSAMIASTNTLDKTKQMADIYIDLPVDQYGLLDFNKLKEIAEIGYQAAKKQIAEKKKQGKLPDIIQSK